jgi:hypothetical protein
MTTPLWGLDDDFSDYPGSPSTIMASHVSQSLTSLEALAAGTAFTKVATGSGGAFVCGGFAGDPSDPSPPDPLTDLFRFSFRANHSPAGACTLDGGTADGAAPIVYPDGAEMTAGCLIADQIVIVSWDDGGSRWILVNPDTQALVSVVGVAESYEVALRVETVLVDASAGDVTVTLPSITPASRKVTVIKTDSSGNYVHLEDPDSSLISGQSSQSFNAQYTSMTVISYGAGWWVI